ncbi:HIT family protein [Leptospira weilii]|uniref:HIT family protein n=1 Tax=Leptospira weilii TaxID=28184 RepID=UPI0002ECDD9D|nr:hydrolase [Leptospira weilii]OMI15951.1 HIT family hydrolase [Leptospira weilii serovar Heyan]ULH30349.1 HIT family hydrolase [Leptospira weilii]
MSECPLCKFHRSGDLSEVLVRFGEFSVRHCEEEKKLKGYLYIEPRSHWTSYRDWTQDSFSDFGKALEFATKWIYKNHAPIKVYTVTVSEMVPHMHFHLIPRYSDDLKGIDYIRLALQGKLPEQNYILDL